MRKGIEKNGGKETEKDCLLGHWLERRPRRSLVLGEREALPLFVYAPVVVGFYLATVPFPAGRVDTIRQTSEEEGGGCRQKAGWLEAGWSGRSSVVPILLRPSEK